MKNTDTVNKIPTEKVDQVKLDQQNRQKKRDDNREAKRLDSKSLNDTLHNLNKSGIGVSVTHWRNITIPVGSNPNGEDEFVIIDYPMGGIREKGLQSNVMPKGGRTTVRLYHDGRSVQDESFCSEKDHFSRSYGLKIALARAMAKGAEIGFPI